MHSHSRDPHARVGTLVRGRWHLEKLLGVGRVAAVYVARHETLGRAALKILLPEHANDRDVRHRFLHDGYLPNRVHHPARVEVLGVDRAEGGEPFFVMELIEGSSLESIGYAPPQRVLSVIEQLLDYLAACHAIHVVHDDLDASHVMITEDDRIKVLDFGLAHLRASSGKIAIVEDSLHVPSPIPSSRGGVRFNDERDDLRAVGVMMSRLLRDDAPGPAKALADRSLRWPPPFASADEMRDATARTIEAISA